VLATDLAQWAALRGGQPAVLQFASPILEQTGAASAARVFLISEGGRDDLVAQPGIVIMDT